MAGSGSLISERSVISSSFPDNVSRPRFTRRQLGRGVHPKIVSEMLGHSTIAITLDTYSHVTPTMQREAAAAVDAVLAR